MLTFVVVNEGLVEQAVEEFKECIYSDRRFADIDSIVEKYPEELRPAIRQAIHEYKIKVEVAEWVE